MARHARPELDGPPGVMTWVDMPVPFSPRQEFIELVKDRITGIIGPDERDWPEIAVRYPGGPRSLPVIRLTGTYDVILNSMITLMIDWQELARKQAANGSG